MNDDVRDGATEIGCTQQEAEELAGRVMAAAGDVARYQAVFLDLIGEFDACGAVGYWDGFRSLAHWVSWSCSLAIGTARDHVRVARALREMPLTRQSFAAGELTYSKVREITRLVGRGEDEAALVELARVHAAAQLSRTMAGYRSAEGTAEGRRSRQRVSWTVMDDATVHVTAVLAPEDGAAVVAAIQAATDANTDADPEPGDVVPDERDADSRPPEAEQVRERTKVAALVEVANHYLDSRPEDRSGEDRTMVVLEVNAAALDTLERPTDTGHEDAPDAPIDVKRRFCPVLIGG